MVKEFINGIMELGGSSRAKPLTPQSFSSLFLFFFFSFFFFFRSSSFSCLLCFFSLFRSRSSSAPAPDDLSAPAPAPDDDADSCTGVSPPDAPTADDDILCGKMNLNVGALTVECTLIP